METLQSFAPASPFVERVQDYVLRLFKQEPNNHLLYHSYQHTSEVAQTSEQMALFFNLNPTEIEILLLAAWLHDVGYLYTYENHEAKSKELAEAFLQSLRYPADRLARVLDCIEATRLGVEPQTLLEEILSDADKAYGVGSQFVERSTLLRMEWAQPKTRNIVYTALEWESAQQQFLETLVFHTQYGKLYFAPLTAAHRIRQADRVGKAQNKVQAKQKKVTKKEIRQQLPPYAKLESGVPFKGAHTFFRTIYPNHISLSAIADNKANMMISINSIVLTLIVALFSVGSGSIPELRQSSYLIPIGIFILTALISLIIAVLSVMPKVTRIAAQAPIDRDILRKNLIFFGNFVRVPQPDYEELMQEMLTDSELLYSNLVRDLYNLGQVLQRKYRLLTISYTAFLIGFTISVLAFLVASFV